MLNANHSAFALSVASSCWAKSVAGDAVPDKNGNKIAFPDHAASKAAFDRIVGAQLGTEVLSKMGSTSLSTYLTEERVEPSDRVYRAGGQFVANEKRLVDGRMLSVTVVLIRKTSAQCDCVLVRTAITVFR